jgi:hypothetical protein
MPFTKFTNLDFDQIKTSIKDYLRANSTFTDFDFEGSNFSVLIDTLAYNTYITAFNSNMVVNESFLDSATVRENIVSLARNIGYVPRSKKSARAVISFTINVPGNITTPQVTLKSGLVCVGGNGTSSYVFSVPEDITVSVTNGTASFNNIPVYQGIFLSKTFTVNTSLNQRFILDNSGIDTQSIRIKVGNRNYSVADNLFEINGTSEIFLIQEVSDEKYELLFGDGIFGKKLENGVTINASYIVTDGEDGNGPRVFTFSGTIVSSNGNTIPLTSSVPIVTIEGSAGGASIESIDSVKYFAPRVYSSQYRAVTARDYEAIIQQLYPNTESVSIVGGEELDPPQFGTVLISIKPKNGTSISDFTKIRILNDLKKYSVAGINQKIIDLKLLYVEIDSTVYYNSSAVLNIENLRTDIINNLTTYSQSIDFNKFGGRFKYSKVIQVIDNVDTAISSNITKVRIRRNMNAILNSFAQYEICFGNQFHKNPNGYNIKSTGFKIAGEGDTVYFSDVPDSSNPNIGILSIVKPTSIPEQYQVVKKSIGTVDYLKGEIIVNTINIVATDLEDGVIEIQAFPESNDVIGLKDLYLVFDISESIINMKKDTITSGEQISGIGFDSTSSYSNGKLTR